MGKGRVIIPVVVFLLVLFSYSFAIAEDVTVKSHKVPVRKGPGFYYKVVYELQRGDTLKLLGKEGKWYKVSDKAGKVGYASARSISYSIGSGGEPTSKNRKRTPIRADRRTSRPMMVAAIRGVADMGMFPRKYAEKHGLDPAEINSLMDVPFGSEEFDRFKQPLKKPSKAVDSGLAEAEVPASDREVGAAITMRLLSVMPPSRDSRLRKYVAMVGTAVQEQTPVYDVPFVFIVLESSKVNSFSTPGGFVFITTGALATIGSEAELAGVLSHEVAHVLKRHGMKELEKQGPRIRSSGMMDDLDKELDMQGMDMGDQEVQASLEDMADQMFEFIVGGRKMVDEDQADGIGTLLLSATGYAPGGLRDFIVKTSGLVTGEDAKTYAYRDAGRRADQLDKVIKTNSLSGGVVLRDRYYTQAR